VVESWTFNLLQVIVFCTTGMVTSLMYLLLREMKMNVREMHSRKPQLYRTHVSDEFQESNRLVLVTSDVSARGMNYPDVTLVIQVPTTLEKVIYSYSACINCGSSNHLCPKRQYLSNTQWPLLCICFPITVK